MISYNFKLIILSIILGAITLIYNNHCDGLYKNMNYKNTVIVATNIRTLGELLHERTTNHIHEKCNLREWKNNNKTKYKKKQYPNDEAKSKRKIPEVTEKENTRTINSNKYDKEKNTQSNKSSRSHKYLEMQRKLYNNFYVKPETDFEHLSDKTNAKNDKTCECPNKKNSSNKLLSSNKVHDNYLDNLKSGCVGSVNTCAISSIITGSYCVAAADSIGLVATNSVSFFKMAFQTFAASGAFGPYIIPIIMPVIIAFVLIILYIWLRKRRKNSWKHECKKHLCT